MVVRWVRHEQRLVLAERCLVEFSIENNRRIGFGECATNGHIGPFVTVRYNYYSTYEGREKMCELKMNGQPTVLFPKVEKFFFFCLAKSFFFIIFEVVTKLTEQGSENPRPKTEIGKEPTKDTSIGASP